MMKNLILLFLAMAFLQSCGDTDNYSEIHRALIGNWNYSKVVTWTPSPVFEDNDSTGVMVFFENELGEYKSDQVSFDNYVFDWDLIRGDSRISITRDLSAIGESLINSLIYDVEENGDKFILKRAYSYFSSTNPGEMVTFEEKIVLTRK